MIAVSIKTLIKKRFPIELCHIREISYGNVIIVNVNYIQGDEKSVLVNVKSLDYAE